FHPALKKGGATHPEEGLVHEVEGEEFHTHLVPYENGPWRWEVGVATPRSHFTEGLDFLRPFTVGLAVATALLATALAFVCSLLVTRPLENLAGSAQRVRGGDLDVDVEIYQRPREIEELSLSFRNMVKGLHEQFFMRRYISGATRAMIARSTGHRITDQEARGTRTEATVLFADIRGFTSFSEKHRPEEVIEVLNRYLALETECVDRHGGIVDKFIGDEVMALFLGAGREPEAVRAALEIQAGIAGITAKRREAGLEPVEVGIGIQSGMVLMGNMGSEARMDYTAVGDVVNVASRLQKLAQGGQVVISRDVADRLDERFEKTFLEAIPIRGRQAPVDVFRVTGYRQPPRAPS
ncbi:MAG: adenylate/guanylate cyclase domain-containing protein, partial [Planctomycetes bacterium]|nr:adenylate/guanylate cyclase domain-containing protein [Planctomycetota bacterium]